MSLKPELNIRETVGRFPPGLVGEIILSVALGRERNLIEDARRFQKANKTIVFGSENLRKSEGPTFIVFNHPRTDVLVEGLIALTFALSGAQKKDFTYVMAGEIPDNSGSYYLWSKDFMERLSAIYHPHILLTSNIRTRPDYREGREQAVKTIGHLLGLGQTIALAAEGDWSKKPNGDFPDSAVGFDTGQIALDAVYKYHGQVLPVGLALDKNTYVVIGNPMIPDSKDQKEVALQIAGEIKELLPQEMVVR